MRVKGEWEVIGAPRVCGVNGRRVVLDMDARSASRMKVEVDGGCEKWSVGTKSMADVQNDRAEPIYVVCVCVRAQIQTTSRESAYWVLRPVMLCKNRDASPERERVVVVVRRDDMVILSPARAASSN